MRSRQTFARIRCKLHTHHEQCRITHMSRVKTPRHVAEKPSAFHEANLPKNPHQVAPILSMAFQK